MFEVGELTSMPLLVLQSVKLQNVYAVEEMGCGKGNVPPLDPPNPGYDDQSL